jgi:hypothetical protein
VQLKLVDPHYQEREKKITIAADNLTVVTDQLVALPFAKAPFGRLRTITPTICSGLSE